MAGVFRDDRRTVEASIEAAHDVKPAVDGRRRQGFPRFLGLLAAQPGLIGHQVFFAQSANVRGTPLTGPAKEKARPATIL